jgi:N-acetylmuramoyl-L-alanine amidase
VALALAAALFLGELAPAHAQFVASRIWPARDYTRVTFESRQALDYSMFPLKDPDRLVIDLNADDADGVLAALQDKVAGNDPYVAALRVAANRPGVTRVVLDLKAEVRPQLFALKPVADYGHRLVLDLYPVVPPDPLAALLAEAARPRWRASRRWWSMPVTAARTLGRAAGAARGKRTSR